MGKNLTYKKAGVDIDKAERFIAAIKPLVRTTRQPGLIGAIGNFSGFFQPRLGTYKTPVLVASTDGVGTKLMVAGRIKRFDTVGIDLVAMCVNDIITCGAQPLFFLDYFATDALRPAQAVAVIKGIVRGCRQAACTLLGGETAEMPGLYPKGEFDIAGFCVGVVDKDKIIDGTSIRAGDYLVGIQSSGLHSNGFSLVRKLFSARLATDRFLRDELLRPTIIYVKPVVELVRKIAVGGIVHITGGGFYGNIPRVLPAGTAANIEKGSWPVPSIFCRIQEKGAVSDREMYTTFNMGIGMVLMVKKRDIKHAQAILSRHKLKSWVIGEVVKGNKEVTIT